MVFSFILQNDGPKSKIFWEKIETKHPLDILYMCRKIRYDEESEKNFRTKQGPKFVIQKSTH